MFWTLVKNIQELILFIYSISISIPFPLQKTAVLYLVPRLAQLGLTRPKAGPLSPLLRSVWCRGGLGRQSGRARRVSSEEDVKAIGCRME